MTEKRLHIYTDGTRFDDGTGGWAAIITGKTQSKRLSGAEASTTPKAMEIRAIEEALEYLPQNSDLVVVTDRKDIKQMIDMTMDSRKNHIPLNGAASNIEWGRLVTAANKHTIITELRKSHGPQAHPKQREAHALCRTARKIYQKEMLNGNNVGGVEI